tara:strand:- start:471 stop:707 length:237 start_codon:yes stop_codon:yes gene_type:complete
MDKTDLLRLDLVHDAPIQGGLSFLDTRKLEFYNEETGKPMETIMYKIVDGTLRIWLQQREWEESEIRPQTPEQQPAAQ